MYCSVCNLSDRASNRPKPMNKIKLLIKTLICILFGHKYKVDNDSVFYESGNTRFKCTRCDKKTVN